MNFDKYRSPHEPSHHWELKKAFMLAHVSSLGEAEVVGLAQTLANIEFLGCSYPPDTMRRVAALAGNMVQEFREKARGRLKRTFVSGSEAANSKINRLNPSLKRSMAEGEDGNVFEPKQTLTKYGNFVKSSAPPLETKNEGYVLPPKNSDPSPKRNPYLSPSLSVASEEQFNNHFDTKLSMQKKSTNDGHQPFNQSRIEVDPRKRKKMKQNAFQAPFDDDIVEIPMVESPQDRNGMFSSLKGEGRPINERLHDRNNLFSSLIAAQEPNSTVVEDADKPVCFAFVKHGKCPKKKCSFLHPEPISSDKVNHSNNKNLSPATKIKPSQQTAVLNSRTFKDQDEMNESLSQSELSLDTSQPFHTFVLIAHSDYNGSPDLSDPLNTLSNSASFCGQQVHWDVSFCPASQQQLCVVKLNNVEVCRARDPVKQKVKSSAARLAVEILRQQCYTIHVKERVVSDGKTQDLQDVSLNKVGAQASAVGAGNMGHKLLSMMGWGGGGLGKQGDGIQEPITATSLFGREGLGSKASDGNLKQRVRKLMTDWVSSGSPYDLVFTSGFTNQQRKDMHEVARRLGLKSKSYGKGEDRYLTISKKFDCVSLLRELLRSGGETLKYSLIPPSPC